MRPAKKTSNRTEGKADSKAAAVIHRADFRLHSHLEYLVPCDPTHRRQVYSYWATLSAKQRTELLTLTKESIRSRAQQLSYAASAEGTKSGRIRFSNTFVMYASCPTSMIGSDLCFSLLLQSRCFCSFLRYLKVLKADLLSASRGHTPPRRNGIGHLETKCSQTWTSSGQ